MGSRISAFESIANPSLSPSFPSTSNARVHDSPRSPPYAARKPMPASPSPSPPNLGRKTSLIDLKDWIVDDGPSSPHTNGYKHYGGMTNGDDNGRTPTQQGFETRTKLVAPLINLESPPRPNQKFSPTIAAKAPPLPPRKPSYTSLKSVASVGSSTGQPYRSDSLTVDHTYPPFKLDTDLCTRNSSGHAPASSISSFHSVSLSSDTDPSTPGSASSNHIATFPIDREREQQFGSEADSASLAESYEEVSTPSVTASPATERITSLDWEKAMAKRKAVPPRLPQRPSLTSLSSASSVSTALRSPPSKRQSSSSSSPGSPGFRASGSSLSSFSTVATGGQVRRAPPPPPSRSSDRSSIQSLSSTYSHSSQGHRPLSNLHLKTKRPTPVPAAARVRYESVFNTNIVQVRRAQKEKAKQRPALLGPTEAKNASRRAAGWRGLSVDLITGAEDVPATPDAKEEEEVSTVMEGTDCLEGHLVKTIWRRSRLDRRRLGEIWHECDPNGTGSLNRDSFVKGMWRIDEELRRAQTQALKSTSSTSLGSLRGRGALFKPPIPNKPRPILR
ncbi:hypothetical protein DXG03_007165 [Asterophora parasitica]|uniref:EH domain-containing protein n=1 Tax=Asterophora parasitica TaxID=117018 RepID=A0A9P7KDP7_9AGAR|nr:hypothetical protein DXG03_007165 [Asterophora parasitica]